MFINLIKLLIFIMCIYIIYSALKMLWRARRPRERVQPTTDERTHTFFRPRQQETASKTIILDKDQYKVE